MGKDPAFLFYPGDWLGGTMGMTFEDKGAYMELLMLQFNRGHMNGQVIGQTVGQIWERIKFKFEVDSEGMYYNKRLEIEVEKRKRFVESRYNNVSGVNQYTKKTGHKDGQTTPHMEDRDINEDKIINVSFETFWNLYGKKVGAKDKCEKKWNKLTDEVRQKIIDTLPKFKASIKEKQFQPFPETYLNQERWNDEIEDGKPEIQSITVVTSATELK
jgi:uncharacterized protein YdaU (DUF1376 family)